MHCWLLQQRACGSSPQRAPAQAAPICCCCRPAMSAMLLADGRAVLKISRSSTPSLLLVRRAGRTRRSARATYRSGDVGAAGVSDVAGADLRLRQLGGVTLGAHGAESCSHCGLACKAVRLSGPAAKQRGCPDPWHRRSAHRLLLALNEQSQQLCVAASHGAGAGPLLAARPSWRLTPRKKHVCAQWARKFSAAAAAEQQQ